MKAVYNATKEARRLCVEEHKPVLIEALTYRVSHHSTSDDSTAYRSKDEVESWKSRDSPITRFRKYLEHSDLWNEVKEEKFKKEVKAQIRKSFLDAEKLPKPPITDLFTDVYDKMPKHLIEQQKELERLRSTYPESFDASKFQQ
jgi:2-oxoisovalerate dehydrogenase E1 component alpha subunit